MSHYTEMALEIKCREDLLNALADLGFPASKVEVHDEPVNLIGYHGDTRKQVAQVIIRRRYVGRLSNDIGFEETSAGWQSHISEYDSGHYNAEWQDHLKQRCGYHAAVREMEQVSGYRKIEEKVLEDGSIQLLYNTEG